MEVTNAVRPSPGRALRFFLGRHDGPIVMVNLLKFRPFAKYADRSDAHITGREAYLRHGAVARTLVESVGGHIRYSGDVTGILLGDVEELWDAVALAEYPSVRAFRSMALSREMKAIEHHREAGLLGQLNIRTRPQS